MILLDLEILHTHITAEQSFAAKHFADNVDIAEYGKRNQKNEPLIRKQIYEGKSGEFGVYNWKKSLGEDVSNVDVTIYPKNEKSFAQDLMSNGSKVHVKSEDVENGKMHGSPSFIFQYANLKSPGGKDIHAFDRNCQDPVVLCVVDGNKVSIMARTYIHVLHKYNLFCQPRSTKLYGIKKAVYLCDLFDMEKTINGSL